jgi:hypothetical protein
MCFMGGGGDNGAAEARAREDARQASIRAGMGRIDEIFGKFNDEFYNSRRDAYTGYATPQLDDQWKKAQDDLTYALSRSGLLNSSVAAEKLGDARKQYDRQKQAIESTGMDYANQARGDVERNRSDVVAQLNGTADPDAAAAAALNRSNYLNATPAFQPLGLLFQNVAANIGGQMEARRADEAARGISLYGAGGRGSGRVVN